MSIPEDALRKLMDPALVVHVGDVWWVPAAVARYPGGKDRFCLIVALESDLKGALVRAHFVAGSTERGSQPRLVVDAGEVGTPERTYFGFWWSGKASPATLTSSGKWRGRLHRRRLIEITQCIQRSKRADLKRLVK